MNRIFKRSKWLYAIGGIFAVAMIVLLFTMLIQAKTWVSQPYNKHMVTSSGSIYDRNGTVLVSTKNGERTYNADSAIRKATLHVVGDSEGFISTGAQTAFRSQLTGYNLINGLYASDSKKNDLTLTIDAELSVTAYKALGNYKGCIGVYNYKTGEILCAVSTPTYDPANKPDDIDDSSDNYKAVYMNRFFSGTYTPGSTFKIITSACALENVSNIESMTFTCPGYFTTKSGSKVKCNSTHGTVTFKQGLNRSCNTEFAQIACNLLTNNEMMATAKEFGFGKTIEVNGIKCATSTFDLSDAYDIDRAWAGIGQYTTMVNPCHEITILGAIANKTGITPNPTLIYGSRGGNLSYCSSTIARKLNDLLRSNVTDYYKDSKFPNLEMCGKTGTAQVSNGNPHTWFAGYSQRDDLPLCIVVVLENSGGYGLTNAIPVANTVMQKALSLYAKS